MKIAKGVALLLMTLFAAACASEGGGWAGSVRDSAGVEIVSNPADGLWTEADAWTVVEELRIGSLEEDPDYMFGQVGTITVDSQGRIYAIDVQAQQIKIYSPEGVYEKTIGARGSGPGELLGAMFLLMGPGDTLVVPDLQNMRLNRFAPSDEFMSSSPLNLQEGIPIAFAGTPSGHLVRQVREFAFPGQPEIEDPQDAIVSFTTDGTVMDTLLTFPSGESFRMSGGAPEFNIYSAEASWDVQDDLTLVFGVNDEYRIGLYTAGGELERVIRKPFERKPVGDRDKEAITQFIEQQWRNAGVPAQTISQLRNNIHFGESFPAFVNIVAGPEGTVWVQQVQAASELSDEEYASFNPIEDQGSNRWDVFDGAGRYLGVISMPRRFMPRIFRDDRVYGVWRDELDVQYIVKLRVQGIREYRES